HTANPCETRDSPAARLAAERNESVSVCLPARNEVATIGPILQALMPLIDQGVVDQVVVVDDSTDGTAEGARARSAGKGRCNVARPAVAQRRDRLLPRCRLRGVRRAFRLRARRTAAHHPIV